MTYIKFTITAHVVHIIFVKNNIFCLPNTPGPANERYDKFIPCVGRIHIYGWRGFLRKLANAMATPANAAAIKKLDEKLPVRSARTPATEGPVI